MVAVASIATLLGACTPVMITRYWVVPTAELAEPHGESYRFELAGGSTVDMTVTGKAGGMLTGRTAQGRAVQLDPAEVRRVGVAREEKDAAATNIKTFWGISMGYAGFLLGGALLLVMGARPR